MDVRFTTFAKKPNSTKIPSVAHWADDTKSILYQCNLIEPCSILAPQISLNLGTGTPTFYNYARINTFGRYYFVTNWTYNSGLWYAQLSEDVLGTYKTQIGSDTRYILRCSDSSAYDLDVVDNYYAAKTEISHLHHTPSDDKTVHVTNSVDNTKTLDYVDAFNTSSYQTGYFYIKVVNGSNSGNGVTMYMLDYSGYSDFVTALFNLSFTDYTDVSTGVARSLANPLQYIVDVYWLPFALPGYTLSASCTINIGYWPVTVSDGVLINPDGMDCSMHFEITVHPQSTRGNYLNSEPYTTSILQFHPFGNYSIPMSLLQGGAGINVLWHVDLMTGEAILNGFNDTVGNLVFSDVGTYKVPINIFATRTNILGAIGSVLHSEGQAGLLGKNKMESYGGVDMTNTDFEKIISADEEASSGVMNPVYSAESYIGSALAAFGTSVNSKGSYGALLPFTRNPILYTTYLTIVDEDLDHIGRPCCEDVQINTLSGYIQCRDSDTDIGATSNERTAIGNFLVGGFFYE